MTRKGPMLVALVVLLSASVPGLAQQASRLVSPEVHPDRRVTFRLQAPKVEEVLLSGEFLTEAKKLNKGDDGIWSLTIGPLEPEIYEYEYTIDGVQTIDPANATVRNGVRTTASLVNVPGAQPAFYDARAVPHGKVEVRWYDSRSIGTTRRAYVYTPPTYDAGEETRYPVLYLLHGADGDDSVWTWLGRANLILDNLIADGKMAPMVVVMPFGYSGPLNAITDRGRDRAAFENDLLRDLIPFVEGSYRVAGDRGHRALAGLSMGGGQALTIGLNHLETFSRVAGFSSAVRNAEETFKEFAGKPDAANRQLRLLWVGCGTEDSLFDANKQFSEFLTGKGIKHTFRPSDGAHTWIVWRHYLAEVAPLLFPGT